jgi:ankyrin repeat protein
LFPLILDSKKLVDNWSSYDGFAYEATISKDELLEHIELGANLSETSVRGYNFMYLAAFNGWQEAVEKLNKADETLKNAQANDVVTPLMYAAAGKKTGIVRYLLEQGANPKLVNMFGWNILHYSCYHGDLQGNHLFILTYP